jgi:hypothetical protein
MEILLFGRADIFNARKLEIGKLLDFERWLRLRGCYWLEGTRLGGLDRRRLVRIGARGVPPFM